MLKYCNDDKAIATHQSIIQQGIIIARRMEEQQPLCPPAGSKKERQEEFTDVPLAAPAKKRRSVDILSTATSSQEAMRLSIDERVRLSRYLGYNQSEINSSPLKWWKYHGKDLPYISILAKKYLSICATSCASERVFSTSGNIVASKRNCLKPDKVDKLVVLAKNL